MAVVTSRFEVHLVNLDPTVGHEICKVRPCLIISPDEINHNLATVIIAPMTTKGQLYPTRVQVKFQGKAGHIVLDQIRTIDRIRLVKRLGKIDEATRKIVCQVLQEMFAF